MVGSEAVNMMSIDGARWFSRLHDLHIWKLRDEKR
jgi:hypothetical protein